VARKKSPDIAPLIERLWHFDQECHHYWTMCLRDGLVECQEIQQMSDWQFVWEASGNIVFYLHQFQMDEPMPLFLDGIRRPLKAYVQQGGGFETRPYVYSDESSMSALLEYDHDRFTVAFGVTSGYDGQTEWFEPLPLPFDVQHAILNLLRRLLGRIKLLNPRKRDSEY
jgi:hypothetical protein